MAINTATDDPLSRSKRNKQALIDALVEAGAIEGPDLGHWRCPWHGKDTHGSLSIFEKDGIWFFKCHKCDHTGTIVDVLILSEGLDVKEAVKEALARYGPPVAAPVTIAATSEEYDLPDLTACGGATPTTANVPTLDWNVEDDFPPPPFIPETASAPARRGFNSIDDVVAFLERKMQAMCTRRDVYTDGTGKPILTMLRLDKTDGSGKEYRPVRHEADGRCAIGDPPGLLPLFNLPALISNPTAIIVVVEGEKAAMALLELGQVATTNSAAND